LTTLSLEQIAPAEEAIREAIHQQVPEVCRRIEQGKPLDDEDRSELESSVEQAVSHLHNAG
jgi:gluconate kinase